MYKCHVICKIKLESEPARGDLQIQERKDTERWGKGGQCGREAARYLKGLAAKCDKTPFLKRFYVIVLES